MSAAAEAHPSKTGAYVQVPLQGLGGVKTTPGQLEKLRKKYSVSLSGSRYRPDGQNLYITYILESGRAPDKFVAPKRTYVRETKTNK